MNGIKRNGKTIKLYLSLLFIALLIEIFIFNLSAVRSIRYGEGIEITDRFSVSEEAVYDAKTDRYTVAGEEFTLYMEEVNADIRNLYIGIDFIDNVVDCNILITDEGDAEPYGLSTCYLLNGKAQENSRYVTMHPYGKVKTIKMVFSVASGENFHINHIFMNARKPVNIRIERIVALFALFSLFAFFRKGARIHEIVFRAEDRKQMITGLAVFIVFLIFAAGAYCSNMDFWKNHGIVTEYYDLTKALLKGDFNLDYEPIPELLEMENPYDKHNWTGLNVPWDTAFYQGKFYCYFGITPVLLIYLPLYVLTGIMIENRTVNLIFSFLLIAGSFYFIRQVIKKWGAKTTPFFAWPVFSALLCFAENFFYLYMRPDFYNVPITSANALTIWGLGFWIKSTLTEKRKILYYFAGSACMALVAGCRPQMVLISFLAIPLFWNVAVVERKLFSKETIKETLAFCLPYIVMAIFLMYYNYMRFGNVFEFGAQYNLTTNDMTKRGFNLDRLGLGLFTFLIQPPNIIATFPYLREALISSHYMGKTIIEFVFGGVFASNLIALLNMAVIYVRDILKKYKIYFFVLTCLGLAVILSCIDATVSGILQRYTADLAMMILIPACMVGCVLLGELGKTKGRVYDIFSSFVIIAFAGMLIFDFFLIFAQTGEFNVYERNQELYYYVESLFHI